MRVGYIRIFTQDKTLHLQRTAMTRAKCDKVFEERASGKMPRPGREACLRTLGDGDTLVVWRLDRLGRSLGELIRLVAELRNRGIKLESLSEKLKSDSPTSQSVFRLFDILTEFERNLLEERAQIGLNAMLTGKFKGGRPRKLAPQEMEAARALLQAKELATGEVARRFGVSRSTLYRNTNGSATMEPKENRITYA